MPCPRPLHDIQTVAERRACGGQPRDATSATIWSTARFSTEGVPPGTMLGAHGVVAAASSPVSPKGRGTTVLEVPSLQPRGHLLTCIVTLLVGGEGGGGSLNINRCTGRHLYACCGRYETTVSTRCLAKPRRNATVCTQRLRYHVWISCK